MRRQSTPSHKISLRLSGPEMFPLISMWKGGGLKGMGDWHPSHNFGCCCVPSNFSVEDMSSSEVPHSGQSPEEVGEVLALGERR